MDLWMIVAIASVLLAVTLGFGVYFWWPSRGDPLKRTDLGLAMIAGVIVAFSILGLETLFDERLHDLEERRDEARFQAERAADARAETAAALDFIHFNDDLSDINLSGLNLSRLFLRNKKLTRADFARSNLTDAVLAGADAKTANFRNATLRRVIATGGNFAGADFTDADLREANFAEANVRGAALILSGAQYDAATTFPVTVHVPPCAPDATCRFPKN